MCGKGGEFVFSDIFRRRRKHNNQISLSIERTDMTSVYER